MAITNLKFREELPDIVSRELDSILAEVRAFLYTEHNEDGTHNVSLPSTTIPIGAMVMWGADTPPSGGWLLCQGQAISRGVYFALFAIYGTTYGAGDGSTSFNLPDFRQRFPLGKAASGTGNTLGATGGSIDHTHTGGAHTHTIASGGAHTHAVASHTHGIQSDGGHSHAVNSHTHSISSGGAHTHTTGAPSATVETEGQPPFESLFVSTDTHTHTTDSQGDHDHGGATGSASPNTNNQGTHTHGGVTDATAPATDSQGAHDHGAVTGSGGTGATSATNPPFLVMNVAIYTGVVA